MEKIKKLNLELALFVKEVNGYIENVNEIDENTVKLLTDAIISVNKFQINSKLSEKTSSSENGFVENLNGDIFQFRRYIICSLCHEQIPLNSEDYNIHVQRQSHKDNEAALHPKQQNVCNKHDLGQPMPLKSPMLSKSPMPMIPPMQLIPPMPLIPSNDTSRISDEERANQSIISSNGSLDHNDSIETESKTSSIDIPSKRVSTMKLADVIDANQFPRAIIASAIDLTSRTPQRIAHEKEIVKLLMVQLMKFDSTLRLLPIGSTTYGFGGSNTNFNILINAGSSTQRAIDALRSFESHVLRPQADFKMLATLNGDRVQKRRLQMIHKASDIRCSIQFDLNFDLVHASQIIRNCILHEPLCYHLIAYVRAWQNALNDMAVKKGFLFAFRFNTYIIAVLVIFYLQLNHEFPLLADVPSTNQKSIDHSSIPGVNKDKLKKAVSKFFEFYGRKYEKCKLISLNIGRWQNAQLNRQQTVFTPEQTMLRESMKLNPKNWKNCSMYVQDIKLPGVNITAELTEEEVDSFKQICKMFIPFSLHDKNIDEYLSKMAQASPLAGRINLPVNTKSEPSKKSVPTETFPNLPAAASQVNFVPKDKLGFGNIGSPPKSTTSKMPTSLLNSITIDQISVFIKTTAVDLIFRTLERITHEMDLVQLLGRHLKAFDSKLELMPFGSSTYGFGGCSTDFNILVSTGDSTQQPIVALRSFEKIIKWPGSQNDFEVLDTFHGDRVQKRQLQLLHTASGIKCTVQFDANYELAESSQMIRDCISYTAICHHLIAYVRSWQDALNKMATQNGLSGFRFNTYIISALVIFFLQVNQKLPKLANLPTPMAQEKFIDHVPHVEKENLKRWVSEFFKFYGNQYDVANHIISVNIGEWQNRHITQHAGLTSEQKRLLNSIESNSCNNWTNCTMYVQDFKSPGTNVAAEIPEEDAKNFIEMCKLFSTTTLHEQIIDEYLLNVAQLRTAILNSTAQNM